MTESEQLLDGKTPLELFRTWLEEAKGTSLKQPEAFTLATVSEGGQPRARVLLLKEIRPEGLVFFTNYNSQKGLDLKKNPKAALNFFWDPMARQVLWQGSVQKLPRAESERYWTSRPRSSQLSQWVSRQSQPVKDRSIMDAEWKIAENKFSNKEVPCPEHWGGYLLSPTYVEFWLGREGRFHDRYAYQKVENSWRGQRLYP